MLRAVARMITGKADLADLQQQIHALKVEGAEASAEIDKLKQLRASATSYDEARDLDDRINRQIWLCEHAAAAIPELELQLAAARAAAQAAALARHKTALVELYPRLKRALVAAVAAQEEAMAARGGLPGTRRSGRESEFAGYWVCGVPTLGILRNLAI